MYGKNCIIPICPCQEPGKSILRDNMPYVSVQNGTKMQELAEK
jgi:hypothetical protein